MRIIEKSIPVYTFEELSDSAKKRAKNNFLCCSDWRCHDFQDLCKCMIKENFPNSDLNFEFSLNSCQGDGFNIYGNLAYSDIMGKIKYNFTEKEIKTLNFCFLTFYGWTPYGNIPLSEYSFTLTENNHYFYCNCDENDFYDNVIDDMEYNGMRDIPERLLWKFGKIASDYIHNYCSKLADYGYDYLYNISDEEYGEISEYSCWEYTEDGNLYLF